MPARTIKTKASGQRLPTAGRHDGNAPRPSFFHGIRHAKLLFPGGARGEKERAKLDSLLDACDEIYNWGIEELRAARARTAYIPKTDCWAGMIPPDLMAPLPRVSRTLKNSEEKSLRDRWVAEKKNPDSSVPRFPELCQAVLSTVFDRRLEPAMDKFYAGQNRFPRAVRRGKRSRSFKHERNTPSSLRLFPSASGRRWVLKIGSVGAFRLGTKFSFDPETDTVQEVNVRERGDGGYSVTLRLRQNAPPSYAREPVSGGEIIGIDVGGRIPIATSADDLDMLHPDVKRLSRQSRAAQKKMSEIREKAKTEILAADPSIEQKELSRRIAKAADENIEYRHARKKHVRAVGKIRNKYKHGRQVAINGIMDRAAAVAIQNDGVKDMMEKKEEKETSGKRRSRNRLMAKAGMAESLRMIQEKAEARGVAVLHVPRNFPSSQTCSACGYRLSPGEWKKVSGKGNRVFKCPRPDCRAECDRDRNAAVNIRNEGIRIKEENRRKDGVKRKRGADSQPSTTGRKPAVKKARAETPRPKTSLPGASSTRRYSSLKRSGRKRQEKTNEPAQI